MAYGLFNNFLMTTSEQPSSQPSLQVTKATTWLACVFFLLAVLTLEFGDGIYLWMDWPSFLCTWGIMFFAAFISFIGFFTCKRRGERISVFYVICPSLLFLAFAIQINYNDIIRAVLDHAGLSPRAY